jgi:hypothetical protein
LLPPTVNPASSSLLNKMKSYITAILLLPIFAIGQTFTTHDSRFGIEAVESAHRSIDIAVTDVQRNPDYDPIMRVPAAPALMDVTHKIGVTITGTVAQAEAELNKLRAWSIPVTPRQFKLALLDIDVYPETVEAAIATVEDPRLRTTAQIEWREAIQFRRDHPILRQLAPLLGATDDMLDAIFLNAQGK